MTVSSYKISGSKITLDTGNYDFSYARTPPSGDSSTKIATTEFLYNGFLPLSGGTITGSVTMEEGLITSSITPYSNNSIDLYYGPSNSYKLALQQDGNLVVYNGNSALFTVGGTNNTINCEIATMVPTVSSSDNSGNAASTQWVNNQDYVKGNLSVIPANGDKVGLGLYFDGTNNLPCFIYNNGTENVSIDLATSSYSDGRYLKLSGGTLTGPLTINSNLTLIGNQTTTGNITLTGTSSTISSSRGSISYTPSVGDQSTNIANTQFVYNSLQNYVSGSYGVSQSGDFNGKALIWSNDGNASFCYNNGTQDVWVPLADQNWTSDNYLKLSGGTVTGSVQINQNLNVSGSITSGMSINGVSGTLSYNIPSGDSSNNIANTKFVTSSVQSEATTRNNAIIAEAAARANADSGKYDKTGGPISGSTSISGSLTVAGNISATSSSSTVTSNTITSNYGNVYYTPSNGDSSNTIANTRFVHNYVESLGYTSSSSGTIDGGYYIIIGGILTQTFQIATIDRQAVYFPMAFSGIPVVNISCFDDPSLHNVSVLHNIKSGSLTNSSFIIHTSIVNAGSNADYNATIFVTATGPV